MPPIPDERPEEGGIRMSPEEQQTLSNELDGLIKSLTEKGYTATDLHVVFSGFEHRLNAQQYDPYEYDRIALSLKLRATVESWREEQETDVPEFEIAETLRDLSKVYRESALEEMYRERGQNND